MTDASLPLPRDIRSEVDRDLSYERRVVVFYDVLGWRNHIERAGADTHRIWQLRRMILRFAQILALRQEHLSPDFRFTAFSDNIVVSCPPTPEDVFDLLGTMASFQLGSAAAGFLIRGGITVGEIFHDRHSVFGPALVRAYDLERKLARMPRIVLDDTGLFAPFEPLPPFVVTEDMRFIDPFTPQFISYLADLSRNFPQGLWKRGGVDDGTPLITVPPHQQLAIVLNGITPALQQPLADRDWEKVAWLHDRMAGRLGLPLASSYPRVRP